MKRCVAFMLLLTILFCLIGCSGSQAGVGHVGDKAFYTIIMTTEEREDTFTIIDKAGSAAVSYYGQHGINAISWYSVEGGGWIAWVGSRVRYVPEGFSSQQRTTAFATLTSESNAMSIEEAKAYVPQLAE